MAIESLILAIDGTGWRKKGYVIYEKDSPAVWGSREGLPTFIRVTITGDLTVEQARAYREPWNCMYDWTVNNHNVSLDGYRVTIFGDKVNTSGVGAITRTKLDNHLPNMGFVFFAEAANALTYDFSIYTVATSQWFWGRDLTDVTFQENSYVEGTGVHTIQADYGTAGWPMDRVAKTVEQKGGVVLTNIGSVITFTIERSVVNTRLKEHFRQFIDEKVEERQFYVSTAYVDSVVAAGGTDTKTKAEFLALINNRLDE